MANIKAAGKKSVANMRLAPVLSNVVTHAPELGTGLLVATTEVVVALTSTTIVALPEVVTDSPIVGPIPLMPLISIVPISPVPGSVMILLVATGTLLSGLVMTVGSDCGTGIANIVDVVDVVVTPAAKSPGLGTMTGRSGASVCT